jgi:hypothetical protein
VSHKEINQCFYWLKTRNKNGIYIIYIQSDSSIINHTVGIIVKFREFGDCDYTGGSFLNNFLCLIRGLGLGKGVIINEFLYDVTIKDVTIEKSDCNILQL